MRKNLFKLYDRLSPDERVKLTILAMSRGDDEEVKRLRQTCPRKAYSMSDAAYLDKMDGVISITRLCVAVLMLHNKDLEKVKLLEELTPVLVKTHMKALIDGANTAWAAAGKEGKFWDVPIEEFQEIAQDLAGSFLSNEEVTQMRTNAIARLKGTYQAFVSFLSDHDLDPDLVVAIHPGMEMLIDSIRVELESDMPVDEGEMAGAYKAYCMAWEEAGN